MRAHEAVRRVFVQVHAPANTVRTLRPRHTRLWAKLRTTCHAHGSRPNHLCLDGPGSPSRFFLVVRHIPSITSRHPIVHDIPASLFTDTLHTFIVNMTKKTANKTSAGAASSTSAINVPAWLDGASEAQLLLARVSCIADCYILTAMLTF